jgi:uncharacterized protein
MGKKKSRAVIYLRIVIKIIMVQLDSDTIIAQTKKWITDVVIGCNFCPFAAREMKRGSIHYEVLVDATNETTLQAVVKIFSLLDSDEKIETALIILPHAYDSFTNYLDIVAKAETLLENENYEGIYQLASFHPQYLFAGSTIIDPSNYTNRSPYPMLHFLREDSVSKAIDSHPNIDNVPEQNVQFSKEKGLEYMQKLFAACM